MSFGRQDDFPESTLAEEDELGPPWTRVQGRSRMMGRGNYRGSPQRQGGRGSGPGQRDGAHGYGYRSPHLQQNWEREKVNIDRGAMVSIGRANSGGRNWNRQGQTQQRNNGYNREGGSVWNNRAQGRGNTNTPRQQETPFVQGERVLETKQKVESPEEQKQDKKFVLDKNDYGFDPTKVPMEANPEQLRPSKAMYAFAQTLFKKDVKDWEMQDIYTPGSSEGTSILVSAFVDYAASTLNTAMSISQQLTLSRVAIATAPQRLLEYFKDPFKAMHFMEWALHRSGNLPPVMEPLLCPIDTPNLITDEEVKAKIEDGDLPLEEQAIVIEAFAKCYYPKNVSMIMEVVTGLSQKSRREYIECPGKMEREMKNLNKPLNFSPPKWYRLSLHPEVVIQTTPRQSTTEGTERMRLEISASDVAGKLRLQIDDLVTLPQEKLRTEILKAIPMIFEDRISRAGCSDTFKYFESMPSTELYKFLGREAPTKEAEAAQDVKVAQVFRYLVRLEHIAKKEGGTWTEPAEEILRTWINSIHPILRTRGESLMISMHILAQETVDRLILTTPYLLDGEEIRKHTIVLPHSAEFSQFEVWIKSSCDHLQDIANGNDTLIDAYETTMRSRKVTVKYRSRMLDSQLPVVMIGGSIETAADETIEEELFDRLLMAGIKAEEVPYYQIENIELSTMDGSSFDRVKCVVAARQDAKRLQEMIARVATPADPNRYLATRDYKYTMIGYPPTEASDKAVRDMLRDQKMFKASLVRTSLYGFTSIDPFMDVPKSTKDLCTREVSKNEDKTVAYFLLTMKMRDRNGGSRSTPVTRVSTNRAGTKLYLYAPKTEAEDLVQFTKEVMGLMRIWYKNTNLKLKGDLVEAMQQIKSVNQMSPMEMQAQNSRILQKYGEPSEAQRRLDTSRTMEEITKTAKEGIEHKFIGGLKSLRENEVQEVTQGSSGDRIADETIRRELLVIKDEQRAQMTKIDELTTMVHTMLERTIESSEVPKTLQTISTLIGTSSQSAISSITEVATAICAQMEEQSKQIITNVSRNSEDIATSCNKSSEIDERINELRTLVLRQESAAGMASEAARKTNEQQMRIIEMLDAQQKYLQNMTERQRDEQPKFDQSGDGIENSLEIDTSYQMQSEEYTTEVRQKAKHVLSLFQTMPYRKLQDCGKSTTVESTQESTAISERAASETTAGLESCKTCGKRDYSLLYCDNCNPPSLHHAACMTFVEGLAEYHCNNCYYQGLEEPSHNLGAMDEPGFTEQGEHEDQKIESVPRFEEEEQVEKDISDHSEMSMSSSSSSSSLVKPYTPRETRKNTRTKTLPSLTNSVQFDSKKPKATGTDDISPMQTRAQRLANEKAKKTRQDAFDTSDEEDDGSDE